MTRFASSFLFLCFLGLLLTACRRAVPADEAAFPADPMPEASLPLPETVSGWIADIQAEADSLFAAGEVEPAFNLLQILADTLYSYRQWDSLLLVNRKAYLQAYRSRDYQAGIDFTDSWIAPFPESRDSLRAAVFEYKGFLAKTQGDMQLSEASYEASVAILEKRAPGNMLLRCYNTLGNLYSYKGDYQLAARMYQAGIRISRELGLAYEEGSCLLNLGRMSDLLNKPDEAISLYRQANDLRPSTDGTFQKFLSEAHLNAGRPQEALELAGEALRLRNAAGAEGRLNYTVVYRLLGESQLKLGRSQAALADYQRSLDAAFEEYPPGHRERGKAILRLGDALQQLGRDAEAMAHYQSALRTFLPAFQPASETELPPVEILTQEPWLMEILRNKGKLFEKRYYDTGDPEFLHLAARHHQLAVFFIQQIKLYFDESGAKVYYGDYSIPFIEEAVSTYHHLYEVVGQAAFLDTAFQLSQEANAFLLRERLKEEDALLRSGVDEERISTVLENRQAIRQLKESLTYLDAGLERDSIENVLFERVRRQRTLEADLLASYPLYRQLRFDLPPVPRPVLQEQIASDELVVKYFFGEDSLYIFGLRTAGMTLDVQPVDSQLIQMLRAYRRSVSDLDFIRAEPREAERAFLESAHSLYTRLLHPVLSQLDAPSEVRTLHIVPDGMLGHLVFECLLLRPVDSWLEEEAFLLSRYAVLYHYATGLVYHQRTGEPAREGFLGFGLEYEEAELEEMDLPTQDSVRSDALNQVLREKKMGPLRYAADEVLAVSDGLRRTIFLNEEATKSRFLDRSPHYGLIHLAAHGYVEDESESAGAFLVLESDSNSEEDFLLSLPEVYGLDLQADLVVLSACQTGDGKSFPSEGVISLARGFQLAGSNAVMASQWSITDQTSMVIMESFYDHLRQGKTKSEALRLAKLEYLTNDQLSSPVFRIPAYWAAFILVGSDEAIQLPEGGFPKGWIIGGVLLLAGFLYWRNSGKSR